MKTFNTTTLKISLALLAATVLNTVSAQQNTAANNNLPALILSFTGTTDNSAAELNWVMENETNCKWFVIERSNQSGSFDSISVVAGLNNDHQTSYNFEDQHMMNGNNYYRLRQVDRDGVVKYSQVINLYNNIGTTKMEVYPNPASAVVNYSISSPTADQITVQVYNMAGVVMMTRQQQLTAGTNQQSLAISTLKTGNYFLKIVNREGSSQYVQSFVKVM
jgi:hypothetical protein